MEIFTLQQKKYNSPLSIKKLSRFNSSFSTAKSRFEKNHPKNQNHQYPKHLFLNQVQIHQNTQLLQNRRLMVFSLL